MYRIGLTGNIATGKTLVLRELAAAGAYCLDADVLAHRAMSPGTPANRSIAERFGREVVGIDGEIDRQALGAIVFRDAGALADLEGIIHPWVVAEVERLLAESGARVTVVEAIKLLEASLGSRCDAIWVTTSAPALQRQRLMRDRGLEVEAATLRMSSQPPAMVKVHQADVLLENDDTPEALLALVHAEWRDIERGRAPRRGATPSVKREGDSLTACEDGHRAEARRLTAETWRLDVSRATRMPRLCRALLPVLHEMARAEGLARLALLIPAQTGYRQYMSAMGYEESHGSGRDSGRLAYVRTL